MSRSIFHLHHFTPMINLEGILRHGLLSRTALDAAGHEFYGTDRHRLDGLYDATSLSIEAINAEMFARKQRDYDGDWAILVIDSSVLWNLCCRFCWTNAASSEMTNTRGYLGGPWAFHRMFDDREVNGTSLRETLGRKPDEPTDGQAEVQVLDPVPPSLITGVIVRDLRTDATVAQIMKSAAAIKPIHRIQHLFA